MIIKNKIQDKTKIKEIFDICNSNVIPYYWNDNQIYSQKKELKQHGGFTHSLYKDEQINSTIFNLFYDFILNITKQENIIIKSLFRMQINLLLNINLNDEELKNSIHEDMTLPNYKSIVYYVNDSDGDTIIYDSNKNVIDSITPIAGNYVIFNSNLLHQASVPKNNKKRMVINSIIEV